MGRVYVNRFGRRPGRGLRPWLLIPKLCAVSLYLGGLAAALAVWMNSRFATLERTDPRRLWTVDQVGALIRFLVVPSLLCAMVLGVALWLAHPREFSRRRWLQVKLISLALLIPAAHGYCYTRLAMLRTACRQQQDATCLSEQLTVALAVVLVGSLWVVALGRLKPRLGQSPVRSRIDEPDRARSAQRD
jgi:uncharacterized membrane protein